MYFNYTGVMSSSTSLFGVCKTDSKVIMMNAGHTQRPSGNPDGAQQRLGQAWRQEADQKL